MRPAPGLDAEQPLMGAVPLYTKLYRPPVTNDLVVRPRLLKLLDSSLAGQVTLVTAPAGFGKTTLVSSWLQGLSAGERAAESSIPAAWLSLDENDRDIEVMLRYLVAALRTIFPDACVETLDLLQARQRPPATVVFDTLSNEMARLPRRFVVVLDDLHNLHSLEAYDLLKRWMQYWPHPMHLVLISRINPPLPLAGLRAKGNLTEIRSRDLRFTPGETAEYLYRILGVSVDDPTLSRFQQRMEGWIAGLKLATLSLQVRDDLQTLPTGVIDGAGYIADYLVDEILNHQSPTMQLFLLKTSITEQFCASLCARLMDSQDSDRDDSDRDARACLDQLEGADLFVTALDNRREWYRYHALFREFLGRRLLRTLRPDQVKALHRLAAGWYAQHGMPDQALRHALEAGDLDLAVQFMQQGFNDVLNYEDRPTLERWLRLLPEGFIQQRPQLLLFRAWLHAFRWELDQLSRVLGQVEALLNERAEAAQADELQRLRGQIASLRGQEAYHTNRLEAAVAYCQEALALLPESWSYSRGVAIDFLALGLHASGRATDAERFLVDSYESTEDKTNAFALRLLLVLAINSLQAGLFERAERTLQIMLRQAMQSKLAIIQGWGHYLIGFVYYQWNDLDTAGQHFAEVIDRRFITQLLAARQGMIGQALVYQHKGREVEARQMIDLLSQLDLELHGYEDAVSGAARARLMLMQGDAEKAERWADLYHVSPRDQPLLPWSEAPQITRARILIGRNTAADLQRAQQILDTLDEIARRTYNARSRIEILALRALALMAQGDVAGARESLIQAVELSRPGGLLRVFVDLGPGMQKLLSQIAGRRSVARTVARILDAFPKANVAPGSPTLYEPDQSPLLDGSSVEHLTMREVEILRLMAEPLDLRKIAAQMHISYSTAKRHSINVYDKLQVHTRWEAVARAVDLGILPHTNAPS